MDDERIWIMLDGDVLKVMDECHEELARYERDGTVMTIVPGLDEKALTATVTSTIRGMTHNLETGGWLEAFYRPRPVRQKLRLRL